MRKSEMFDILVDKVCEVCEVRKDDVLAGVKIQAVVDARILAVQYLRRVGLANDDIALFVLRELSGDPTLCPDLKELRMKSKAVDKMFRSYDDRCQQSYAFCLMAKEIKEFCHTTYKELFLDGMKELPSKGTIG